MTSLSRFCSVLLSASALMCSAQAMASWWGSPSSPDAWDKANDPDRFLMNLDHTFSRLPLNGRVSEKDTPWSDTYWPSNRGSIAYRWNSKEPAFRWVNPRVAPDPAIFKIHSPSRAEALRMSQDEIAQLSPAEKLDLFNGNYDYPMTRKILKKNGPWDAYWEGICNGWSPASLNHREPIPVTVKNRDGIVIPFGSSDVKGLLSYYYASERAPTRQIGKRCKLRVDTLVSRDNNCDDMNAGAFHIVMANLLGLRQQGFVADVDRGVEVWNNPVFAFESSVEQTTGPSAMSPSGTVQRVLVSTAIHYADDNEEFPPMWNAVVGTPDFREDKSEYKYWLDLDGRGQIVGGEWVSIDRPDFLWITAKRSFTGDFSALNLIYRTADMQ